MRGAFGSPRQNGQWQEVKLDNLYQEVILDHNRRPRNFRKLEHPSAHAHGLNPLCGDDYHLYLQMDESGVIRQVGFQGQGCAISKSCASILTTAIESKKVEEARHLKQSFIDMLTRDEGLSPSKKAELGKLVLFEGVKKFPIRVKCATLIWRTLEEAFKNETERKAEVSTEEEEFEHGSV